MPDGSSSLRPDGSWDPAAGTIYVWYDALINYVTGAGFPGDAAAFAKWWPADLHVIGKDIARFHAIYWPAMLWSAGLEAPRQVWVHGWLLTQGERMSKSLGNFLDPIDVVRSLGADGARYVSLREVAFDKDSDVSWDSFVRRYNADLANDYGNLLNRTVSMANRYFGGERPEVSATGPKDGLRDGWTQALGRYVEHLESCLLHEALADAWEFVGAANRLVEAEQPWALAKSMKAGDKEAEKRLRGVLGDLVEACRVVALAVAPFMPLAAPKALSQLGYEYPYRPDGNGGPALLDELSWGAKAGQAGRLGAAEPLFPRIETEASSPVAE
jgi:methionyl-tRNA synthetase